jgi:hypothetical protein
MSVSVMVAMVAVGICGAQETPVDLSVGTLPCTPVEVLGPQRQGFEPRTFERPEGAEAGPELLVVQTGLRPSRTHLFLDGRYVGRSDDFDGHPDFLYLRPGHYVVEARLGGYETATFEIDARAGCRSEIKHWMERERGVPKEGRDQGPPPPFPFERVYGPVDERSMRPDATVEDNGTSPRRQSPARLGRTAPERKPSAENVLPGRATLVLIVAPAEAEVSIDGVFVATGRELSRLQTGLSVDTGTRRVEVSAPGFQEVQLDVELRSGETVEREIDLSAVATDQD